MDVFFKTLFFISSLVIMLTGCENTVHGFGKDMQNTGEQIQKSG